MTATERRRRVSVSEVCVQGSCLLVLLAMLLSVEACLRVRWLAHVLLTQYSSDRPGEHMVVQSEGLFYFPSLLTSSHCHPFTIYLLSCRLLCPTCNYHTDILICRSALLCHMKYCHFDYFWILFDNYISQLKAEVCEQTFLEFGLFCLNLFLIFLIWKCRLSCKNYF